MARREARLHSGLSPDLSSNNRGATPNVSPAQIVRDVMEVMGKGKERHPRLTPGHPLLHTPSLPD